MLEHRAYRLLLIGYGYSGRRFLRALQHLQRLRPDVCAALAIVDIAADKLQHLPKECRSFDNLRQALGEFQPTAVVVAVNEGSHYEVLMQLPSAVEAILCEKPLTATVAEGDKVRVKLGDRRVLVNFVERYSPLVADFLRWQNKMPDLVPSRVEFFWGKDRLADSRPSVGVCSEMTHALDLVDRLIGCPAWRVVAASATRSNLASHGARRMDSIDVLLQASGIPIVGHSSFVWPRRHREIVIDFRVESSPSLLYRATLNFDNPLWDWDQLLVSRVDFGNRRRKTVCECSYRNTDYPDDLNGIAKVYQFLKCGLTGERLLGGVEDAGAAQSLKVQEILEEIERKIVVSAAELSIPDMEMERPEYIEA